MTKLKPNLPDFESVLLVMEQIERPQCVFPEFGLNGQQLWGSQVGITSEELVLPQSRVKGSLKENQSKPRSIS